MSTASPFELGSLAPGLLIRDALPTEQDCAQIAAIFNESIRDGTINADTELKDAQYYIASLQKLSTREGYLLLCSAGPQGPSLPAEYGGVLGFGAIKLWSDRAGYRYTGETSVYLRLSLMGRGYGSMLKRALIERCRQWGYHHLIARTAAGNRRSIENNLRFGYEITGTQREATWMNGAWDDVLLLQLILDDVQPQGK